MVETTVVRDAFRHVEAELHAYPYRKKEIERIRLEITNPYKPSEKMIEKGKLVDVNVVEGKNSVRALSDPTAHTAVSLATHSKLIHLERVTDAIEEIYNQLPEVKQEFVRVKYWTKPQHLTTIGICQQLNISDRTFSRWRRQIVNDIAEILGWK